MAVGRNEIARLVEHVSAEYTIDISASAFLRSLLYLVANDLIRRCSARCRTGPGCNLDPGSNPRIVEADAAVGGLLGEELSAQAKIEGCKRAQNEDDASERVYLPAMLPSKPAVPDQVARLL